MQQLLMVIPVLKARSDTKIKAPTLYPRDSEIKKLELTDDQVLYYYRAQRVHQNNVEVMSVFLPIFMIAGFFEPTKVALSGIVVLIFRIIGGIGYLYGQRVFGSAWHLGELYLLYLVGTIAYKLLYKGSSVDSITGSVD